LKCGEFEEVLCVTVLFQAALASRVGKEAQTLVPDDGGNGNHVPDFLRNDVGSEEINFIEAIIRSGPAALDPVACPFKALGGLDLNAPPESPVIENEVVAFVVSPGVATPKPRLIALNTKTSSALRLCVFSSAA